jgi:hypothetical protein
MRAWFLFLAGCISQMQNAVAPPSPAESTGTLTCGEIVTRCDSTCSDPICVQTCTQQGTPQAAQLHATVVECAKENACMDEPCIRTKCSKEADACEADAPPTSSGPPGGQ